MATVASPVMPRAQLILYAIPTGLLAEQCDRLFRMVRAIAPTTAQTYPPHCTLTGFFQRPENADVRKSFCRAAGKHQSDGFSA